MKTNTTTFRQLREQVLDQGFWDDARGLAGEMLAKKDGAGETTANPETTPDEALTILNNLLDEYLRAYKNVAPQKEVIESAGAKLTDEQRSIQGLGNPNLLTVARREKAAREDASTTLNQTEEQIRAEFTKALPEIVKDKEKWQEVMAKVHKLEDENLREPLLNMFLHEVLKGRDLKSPVEPMTTAQDESVLPKDGEFSKKDMTDFPAGPLLTEDPKPMTDPIAEDTLPDPAISFEDDVTPSPQTPKLDQSVSPVNIPEAPATPKLPQQPAELPKEEIVEAGDEQVVIKDEEGIIIVDRAGAGTDLDLSRIDDFGGDMSEAVPATPKLPDSSQVDAAKAAVATLGDEKSDTTVIAEGGNIRGEDDGELTANVPAEGSAPDNQSPQAEGKERHGFLFDFTHRLGGLFHRDKTEMRADSFTSLADLEAHRADQRKDGAEDLKKAA